MLERKGLLEFEGRPITIVGGDMAEGQSAPDFRVTTNSWQEINALDATAGKLRVILSVLSLETSVCDAETRRFNQEAAALGDRVAVLVVSTDLPFTQARWCGTAGVDNVMTLSDHAHADFGMQYGCLLKEPRILRRAVFIVDPQNVVRYVAYMLRLDQEPDYEQVLAAVQRALKSSD